MGTTVAHKVKDPPAFEDVPNPQRGEGPPPAGRADGPARRFARLLVIWWVLVGEYRAFRRFTRGAADPAVAARFADRLVGLGPTFVKLGQILSTRPDVLPGAYVDALAELQERAPELPFATVRSTVERETRRHARRAVREL